MLEDTIAVLEDTIAVLEDTIAVLEDTIAVLEVGAGEDEMAVEGDLGGSRVVDGEPMGKKMAMRRIFWGFCIKRFGIGPLHYVRAIQTLASNFWRYL